jgi:hypothetical protein
MKYREGAKRPRSISLLLRAAGPSRWGTRVEHAQLRCERASNAGA